MVACDECAGYIGVPKFEEYYHGYIDRNEAERRLKARGIPNSYLLRLSRTPAVNDKWETIYVLSYLSSALLCYHFKLVPRLNCFQLGGRLFDCLQGCLSRYYIHDIMTGERLRHPVPPCSPPLEFYTQRLRAVRTFEPNNATEQLGCSVGDRFLLVSDDTKSDWVFVTSLKTRHSGYLPRCCIEKEYPDLIERLEFFHPDASITSTKELLKRAGACSYLLRPSDSRPGLYTLLLYDGTRVRKYRLELVVQSEEISCLNTPVGNQGNDTHHAGYQRRCSVPIAVSTTDSGIKGSDENLSTTNPCHTSEDALTVCQTVADGIADYDHSQQDTVFPMYSTTTKVMYNGVSFPSVEAVVAAIEAYPGWWHPEPTPSLSRPIEDGSGNRLIESTGTDGSDLCPYLSGTSQSGEPGVPGPPNTSVSCQPHLFKPVRRELKPQLNTASPPIYMLLRYAQQLPTQTGVLEIHGEMSMLVTQRKKWKSHYAQLDRRQGILTLRDGEKRKTERFDLSKCVYYPVHSLMYDRAYCFGLILYGASLGDKEDIVFSVDAPLLKLCPTCFSSSVSSVANNSISSRSAPAFGLTELDPSTYAGRPEEVLSSVLRPTFLESGRTHSVGDLSVQFASNAGSNDTSSPTCSCSHVRAVSQEVVYDRWLRCIRLHCRNTRVDACNEEDCDRRQTVLRCHRTLEVKMNNAKLLPASTCKSRRDESIYVISLDGIEVARAYPGSSTVHILLDDFPFGFKKVEVWAREENKRKRSVAMDLELSQFNSALSDSEDSCQPIVNHDSSVGDADTGSHPSSSSICTVREGIYNLGAITYKELHVLPFTHYERFREIMRTCLDSELVPLCIFVWQNLPNESSSRTSFLSSLLLTTIELKCHLKLVLSLLRADIMPQNPTDAFRGNTLGTQILDQYSNIVCTEWRNQCFKRVREEASNSAPASISSAGSHLVKSLSGLSIDHLPAGPNAQKASGLSCRPTPGLAHSSSNNVVGADDTPDIADQTNQIGSPSFGMSGITSQVQQQQPHSSPQTAEQEWHSHLVSIAVDDLVNHVDHFPLQIRWVYSELQAQLGDQMSNSVIRNLVFLRGICPCLLPTSSSGRCSISNSFSTGVAGSSGGAVNSQMYPGLNSYISFSLPECSATGLLSSTTSTAGSSQVANEALVMVAKTLVSLVSPHVTTKGVLSPDQFLAYHHRLFRHFRIPITAPLSAEEIKQLEQLCEREACVASRRSLSRELALLANYFLEALGPRISPETCEATSQLNAGQSNFAGREHRLSGDCTVPPRVPNLLNALYDLEHRTRHFLKHPSKTESAHLVRS